MARKVVRTSQIVLLSDAAHLVYFTYQLTAEELSVRINQLIVRLLYFVSPRLSITFQIGKFELILPAYHFPHKLSKRVDLLIAPFKLEMPHTKLVVILTQVRSHS